jgi:hypothetical protein
VPPTVKKTESQQERPLGDPAVAVAGRARLRAPGPRATARGELALALGPCDPSRGWPAVEGGGDADLRRHGRSARASRERRPTQRRPVRVSRRKRLAPVDLPVDAFVVLEHEERAGQIGRSERSLCKR